MNDDQNLKIWGIDRGLAIPFAVGWFGLVAALFAWWLGGEASKLLGIVGIGICVLCWGTYATRRSRQQRLQSKSGNGIADR